MKKILLFMVIASLASLQARETRTTHFIISYGETQDATAGIVKRAAERAYQTVKNVLDVEAPPPVFIIIVRTRKQVGDRDSMRPSEMPKWAAGMALASKRVIFIRQPAGARIEYGDISETVLHEYTHIAVGSFLEGVEIPRWFSEGLADFTGGTRSWGASFNIGMAAITGRLIPLDKLTYWWPESGNEAGIAYSESLDFVIYIERNYGSNAVRRILHETKKEGDFDAAVRAITGKSLVRLEEEWVSHIKKFYRWLPILTGGATIWALAGMLVVIGYFRKRKIARMKYRLWSMEEQLAGLVASERDEDEEDCEDENPPDGFKFD